MIENPINYEMEYNRLKEFEYFTDNLRILGLPFKIYAQFIDKNIGRSTFLTREIKELFKSDNNQKSRYRFIK